MKPMGWIFWIAMLWMAAWAQESLTLTVGKAQTPRYTLAELERHAGRAPDVRIAREDVEAQRNALAKAEALDGIELFGSAGVGRYKDLVDEDSVWYHLGGRFQGGLSYPMLGSKEALERDKLRASATLEEKRLLEKAARRRSVTALRLRYIDYWEAYESQTLSRAFSALRDGVMDRMRRRSDRKIQLLSETMDVAAQFAKASQILAGSESDRKRALDALRLLTDGKLADFVPYTPRLALPLEEKKGFYAYALAASEELAIYRERLRAQMRAKDLDRYRGVESDLRLTGFVNPEFTTSRQGDGVEISLNVRLPLNWREVIARQNGEDAAHIRKALLELRKESARTLRRLRYEADRLRQAEAALRFSTERMAAALEYWREQRLGLGHVDRVTPVTLQNARYRYYRAALEYVAAYAGRERAKALLLGELPSHGSRFVAETADDFHEAPEAPFAEAAKRLRPTRPSGTLGLYLWRSGFAEKGGERVGAFLATCRARHVGRILLSLDGAQLRRIAEGKESGLRRFLAEARSAGIGVEALLGEPTWLLPKNRKALLRSVMLASSLPFDAVHLDIEPDQLDANLTRKERGRLLLEAITAASQASSLPVGVSLHPRYLQGNEAIGPLLDLPSLYEVAVMIYGVPLKKARARYERLKKRYPSLPLTLAVSAEAEYFPKPLRKVTKADFRRLEAHVADENGSVLIQDYTHWRRLRP